MYMRVKWHGEVTISSLVTSQQAPKLETLIVVYQFDEKGLMLPHFKAAYAKDGKIGLKLQFSKTEASAWGVIDDGPLLVQGTASPPPPNRTKARNVVGELHKPYKYETKGEIALYNLQEDFRPYRSWAYRGFWQLAVGPELNPPLSEVVAGSKIRIDGRGHATDTSFVRSMVYSSGQRELYLKSSQLHACTTERQREPFETFLNPE